MKCSGSGILVPLKKIVALSKIAHCLFAIASTSHCSISISLSYVSAIICTVVAYFMFIYTSVNSCSSDGTTFSSLASFCTICDTFPTPWGTQMWVLNGKQRKSTESGHAPWLATLWRGRGACWSSGMGLGRFDKLYLLTWTCTKLTQGG